MSSIGTSATSILTSGGVVQNLGPDDLWIGDFSGVTSSTGIRLSPGNSIALGSGTTFYGISDGTSEVRTTSKALSAISSS